MQRRSFFTLSALALPASSLPLSAFAIDEAKKEIVIGTTVGDFADMVTDSIKPQLEAKGYKVKLVEFTDYVTPNIALADGSLDVNCFQHKPYLESFAKDRGLSLAPISQVPQLAPSLIIRMMFFGNRTVGVTGAVLLLLLWLSPLQAASSRVLVTSDASRV